MPVKRPGTRTQKKPILKKPVLKKPLLKKVKVKTSVKPSSSRATDIAKPQGKPKLGRKTIKLTVMQLWKTCDAVRREGVKRLAVRTVKKGVVRKSDVLPPDTSYYRVIVYNKDKGHDHKVTIFMPNGPFTKKANIITDCDCIAEGTLILTQDGWKPIESLTSFADTKDVVYMINGKPYVGSTPWHVGKKPVYKVVLDNGMEIETTLDHKFLTSKKELLITEERYDNGVRKKKTQYSKSWRRLNSLNVGDSIVLNETSKKLSVSKSDSYYEGYVCGFFYGEGSYFNTERPILAFTSRSTKILKILNKAGVGLNPKYEQNGHVRIFGDQRLIEILRKYKFDKHTRQSNISLTTLSSDKEYFFGFLSGILDAEGCVCPKGQTHIFGNKEQLKLFQLACIGWGVNTLFRKCANKGESTNLAKRTKDLYKLVIPNYQIHKIQENLEIAYPWFSRNETTTVLKENQSKIIKIEYVGTKHTYDISVPGKTRFVANGMIVHNCFDSMYTFEWVMAKKYGTSFIWRCNGEPPVERNPGYAPGICKHTRMALTYLLKKAQDGTLKRIDNSKTNGTKMSLLRG